MNKNGLTLTIVIDAASANYGEGIGNISSLKKMTRSNGKVYTYISRQALRYNIVEQMGIANTPVDNSQKVVQFDPKAEISEYPEIDLFGYMKTSKTEQSMRSAVVRLSNAISLEPYASDMDFLTNMGLAKRKGYDNAIAQSEIHKSLYSYTITIDLDKIGVDKDKEIASDEKKKRLINLIDTIQFLYRDIKGRRENLNPMFVVGGLYQRKNPYFEDRIKVCDNNIDVAVLKDIINSSDDTKANTYVGTLSGYFSNDEIIHDELNALKVSEVFDRIKEEINKLYD